MWLNSTYLGSHMLRAIQTLNRHSLNLEFFMEGLAHLEESLQAIRGFVVYHSLIAF